LMTFVSHKELKGS